jgi:Ser/Thr protein kinase RdoA (MazF antagonist)
MFRARIDDEVVWLRIGGVMDRSIEQTEQEGRTLTELAGIGIPVHVPRLRVDGRYCDRLQVATVSGVAIAFGEVTGVELSVPDEQQARAWGRTLRQLHDMAVPDSATGLAVVEPLRSARDRLALATAALSVRDSARLEALVTRHAEATARIEHDVINHGDVRCANVRFDGDRATLIDTEALGRGPRAYDLACAWRRRVIENEMCGAPADWHWFREGYEEAGPLAEAAWRQVSGLAVLRALWTMTLPAETDQQWGQSWVSDPTYWAAHFEQIMWFATHEP